MPELRRHSARSGSFDPAADLMTCAGLFACSVGG
jgi:hypothetical protein